MSWKGHADVLERETGLVYPLGAVHTVTVKATYAQRIAWQEAARKYRKGTAGGFLSFAAAFTIAALNVLEASKWPED